MMLILRCASGRELAEAIKLARHTVRPHATAAQQQEHGPATNAYSDTACRLKMSTVYIDRLRSRST